MQLVDMWVAHSLEVQILYSTMNIKGLAMNYKGTSGAPKPLDYSYNEYYWYEMTLIYIQSVKFTTALKCELSSNVNLDEIISKFISNLKETGYIKFLIWYLEPREPQNVFREIRVTTTPETCQLNLYLYIQATGNINYANIWGTPVDIVEKEVDFKEKFAYLSVFNHLKHYLVPNLKNIWGY